MSRLIWSALSASAAVAVAMAVPAAAQVNQTLAIGPANRTISVTSTDSAFAPADQAAVHIGYQIYGPDEASAYAEASKRSNAIDEALRSMGVPAESIESQDQNMQPLNEYELKNLPPALKTMRFHVTQSWTVRTSPDAAAKTLDAAIKAGANQSGSIGWEIKDGSMLEAAASAKALAHAQSIAARMAEGLHIKVGALLYASNQSRAMEPQPLALRMASAAKMQDTAPLKISRGKVERSATVYAIFAVE